VTQTSARLTRRIRNDFPPRAADTVIGRLAGVPERLPPCSQDPERMQASIVLAGDGSPRRRNQTALPAPTGSQPQSSARSCSICTPRPVVAVAECHWRRGGTGDPSTTVTRTPAPSRVSPSVGAEAVWTITLVTTPDISSTAVSRRSSRSQLCSRVRTTVRARPAARASAGSDTRSVRMPQPVAALAARDGATWGS
jgi:hypothetical protein